MASEEVKQRRRSIPVAPWWAERAKQAIDDRKKREPGYGQKVLAAAIEEDEAAVSRALKGKKPPIYEIALLISDELDLPYPAILPDTYEEAMHLTLQRRLFKSYVQVETIAAGVAETTKEDHTGIVPLENGKRRSRQGRATRRV